MEETKKKHREIDKYQIVLKSWHSRIPLGPSNPTVISALVNVAFIKYLQTLRTPTQIVRERNSILHMVTVFHLKIYI